MTDCCGSVLLPSTAHTSTNHMTKSAKLGSFATTHLCTGSQDDQRFAQTLVTPALFNQRLDLRKLGNRILSSSAQTE